MGGQRRGSVCFRNPEASGQVTVRLTNQIMGMGSVNAEPQYQRRDTLQSKGQKHFAPARPNSDIVRNAATDFPC
ncbi:hypothetical protein GCM10009105_25480 [Dokdonella soli]|uniref:Uncharacterized protein n=1 Tax=Dokdonella soli TaxID=529810 RepID=A0ABN1INK3_9GAMM